MALSLEKEQETPQAPPTVERADPSTQLSYRISLVFFIVVMLILFRTATWTNKRSRRPVEATPRVHQPEGGEGETFVLEANCSLNSSSSGKRAFVNQSLETVRMHFCSGASSEDSAQVKNASARLAMFHNTTVLRVACVGDSITTARLFSPWNKKFRGNTVLDPIAGLQRKPLINESNYVKQLEGALRDGWSNITGEPPVEAPLLVYNAGWPGIAVGYDGSPTAYMGKGNGPPRAPHGWRSLLRFKPHLVTFMLGTNDVFDWQGLGVFCSNVNKIIDTIRQSSGKAPSLVFMTPPPNLDQDVLPFRARVRDEIAPAIRRIAALRGALLVDVNAHFERLLKEGPPPHLAAVLANLKEEGEAKAKSENATVAPPTPAAASDQLPYDYYGWLLSDGLHPSQHGQSEIFKLLHQAICSPPSGTR